MATRVFGDLVRVRLASACLQLARVIKRADSLAPIAVIRDPFVDFSKRLSVQAAAGFGRVQVNRGVSLEPVVRHCRYKPRAWRLLGVLAMMTGLPGVTPAFVTAAMAQMPAATPRAARARRGPVRAQRRLVGIKRASLRLVRSGDVRFSLPVAPKRSFCDRPAPPVRSPVFFSPDRHRPGCEVRSWVIPSTIPASKAGNRGTRAVS